MEGKNSAQLKNESAVKRRMQELGYDTSKPYKKKRQIDFSSFFKSFFAVIILAACGVSVYFFINGFPWASNNQSNSEDGYTEASTMDLDYTSCLASIDDSPIDLEDADFWNKHIVRYEEMIACYDKYPEVADSSERDELQARLEELRLTAADASAADAETRQRYASSEAEYYQKIAASKAEYERRSAEIDAETQRKFEEYDRQRAERDAEYAAEAAERERIKAACDSFNATYPNSDAYLNADGTLAALWQEYEAAKNEYNHASSAAEGARSQIASGRQGYDNTYAYWVDEMSRRSTIMNEKASAYNSRRGTLSNQYYAEKKAACGY